MKNFILVISLTLILGCKKENTNPTTTTVTNNTTIHEFTKWTKPLKTVIYEPDGVTESNRTDYTYDSEGRLIGMAIYQSGVLSQKYRDYTYNGDECTYYYEFYTNGALTSTRKMKTVYKNN